MREDADLRQPLRSILQNMTISLLTFIFGYAMIEGYFAVTYRPGLSTTYESFRFESFNPPLNEAGFRQYPFDSHLFDENAVRILFLGDSVTFGFGVADGNARFTDLLAARLDRTSAEGHRYYVYNAGISGTEPTRWIGYLQKLMPSYRPNIVFAVFFLRDGTNICTSLVCFNGKIAALRAKYAGGLLSKYSYVARALEDRAVADEFNSQYEALLRNAYIGSEIETATWRREKTSLLALASICRDNGIAFHIVLFPVLMSLDRYPFDAVEAEISRFAGDHVIPSFSLTPGFRNRKSADLWVSPGDQHPNARAHRIAADTLYPYLIDALAHLPRPPDASNFDH
jgi:hypothetical protein